MKRASTEEVDRRPSFGRTILVYGAMLVTAVFVFLAIRRQGDALAVISPTLFAMLVIMALVTTFATSPILAAIVGRERRVLALEREKVGA